MSLWAGLSAVFSGNADKALDMASGIGNFIDESIETSQEKSEAKLALVHAKIKWVAATTGQNLARRYCAIFFGINYLIAFQVCLITRLVDYIKDDSAIAMDFIADVVSLVATFQLGWIMLAIISFYFLKEHSSFAGIVNRVGRK